MKEILSIYNIYTCQRCDMSANLKNYDNTTQNNTTQHIYTKTNGLTVHKKKVKRDQFHSSN